MPVIGPGLTLIGAINSTLLAYSIHTSSPPNCQALTSTAEVFGLSVLYVHVRKFGHGEHTVFKTMKKLTSLISGGELSQWVNPKHIMYLDCYDNMVTQSSDHIVTLFESFGTDLLIAGEENCYPDPTKVWSGENQEGGKYAELYQSHPEIRAPSCLTKGLRFANLGGIIGSLEALNGMATWILEHYPKALCIPDDKWPNDQACLHRYVMEGLPRDSGKPHLDCGRIFMPLWNVEGDKMVPFIRLDDTNAVWPALFHFNGHVTKAIKPAVEACLTGKPDAQLTLPIETERAKFDHDSPVTVQVLQPLCERLMSSFQAAGVQLS